MIIILSIQARRAIEQIWRCKFSSVELGNRKRTAVLKFKRHLLYVYISLSLFLSPSVWPHDNISIHFSSLCFVVLYCTFRNGATVMPSNHLICKWNDQRSISQWGGSDIILVGNSSCAILFMMNPQRIPTCPQFPPTSTSGSHTHIVTHAQCTNFSATNTHLHTLQWHDLWTYGPVSKALKLGKYLCLFLRVKRSMWSIVIHHLL